MKSYKGKTVLVTGASSGIGKAFAESLAEKGANLIIVARSGDKLKEQASELEKKYSVQVGVIVIDLSESGSAKKIFQQTQTAGLSVDVLINNAGFGKWGDFLEFDLETYSSMLSLNINSLVELCHLYLPEMVKKKDGGIINVGSTASFVPVPYAAVYSASKAFVLYFSEALYGEYNDKGVTVMTLCPGGTESNFATVANSEIKVPREAYESPKDVVNTALPAFLNNESYVISGFKNYMSEILPRFLPRKVVIQLVGNMWKKVTGK